MGKIRENVADLQCLLVDNFDFPRKIVDFLLTLLLMKFSSKVDEDDYSQSSIAVCELQYLQYLMAFGIRPRYLRIHLLQRLDDHCKSPRLHHWCRYHHRYHRKISKLNFYENVRNFRNNFRNNRRIFLISNLAG